MRNCPQCRTPMDEVPAAGVTTDRCSRCGSIWLDKGELHGLAQAGPEAAAELDTGPANPAAEPGPTLLCPDCARPLIRVSFKKTPDLAVQGCRWCGGLWFRAGSLAELAGRTKAGPPPARTRSISTRARPQTVSTPAPRTEAAGIPVGRVFRPNRVMLAFRALMTLVGIAFVAGIAGAVAGQEGAPATAQAIWMGGGALALLYPLVRFWVQCGDEIRVRPGSLVQRSRFRTWEVPFAAMIRLEHQGQSIRTPYRHSYGYDWYDLIGGGAVITAQHVTFEVVSEGDWRDRITFSEDVLDWQDLVDLVTHVVEGRYASRPGRPAA